MVNGNAHIKNAAKLGFGLDICRIGVGPILEKYGGKRKLLQGMLICPTGRCISSTVLRINSMKYY